MEFGISFAEPSLGQELDRYVAALLEVKAMRVPVEVASLIPSGGRRSPGWEILRVAERVSKHAGLQRRC
jgi:hypothetical protein